MSAPSAPGTQGRTRGSAPTEFDSRGALLSPPRRREILPDLRDRRGPRLRVPARVERRRDSADALQLAVSEVADVRVGGVEARHAAVLRMAALGQSPLEVFPDSRGFFPGDNPLAGIEGALITA